MPLQDFETFKREHIDRPAVGDIWRHLESNELFQIMRSDTMLVLCRRLSDENVVDVINILETMNDYTFHTRAVSTNYINQPLGKKFIRLLLVTNPIKVIVQEINTDEDGNFTGINRWMSSRPINENFSLRPKDFFNDFIEIESYIQRERNGDFNELNTLEKWYDKNEGLKRGETYNREQFHLIRDFTFTEHLYYDDMGADPSEDGKYSCDFTGNNKVDPVRLNSGHIYCFEEIKGLLGQPQSQWKCPNSRIDITSIHIMTQEEIDEQEKKAVETEQERLNKLKRCKGYVKKINDTKEEIKKKQERLDDVRKSRDQPVLKF